MQDSGASHFRFKLGEQEAHAWPVSLDAPEAVATRFRDLLTADEQERAARFRFEKMQRTFAIARGTLRILLSRYLGCAAREIRFCYGNRGKPSLAGTPRLQFNMSHSGAMALFAFTLDCAIGVDIEQIRPIQDMNDIAARFFAPDETASLMSLAASERERAFFRCWTRKEAFIKATGDGLSTPLDSFSVTLDPGDAARFVRLPADAEALGAWSVHDLVVAPDYAAAAAYPDSARTITVVPLTHPATLLELV